MNVKRRVEKVRKGCDERNGVGRPVKENNFLQYKKYLIL
jgi:hypothetical protein